MAVLHARSEDSDLVVKIGWLGSKRVAENVFLEKVVEVVRSDPKHQWALNYLPNVHFSQSVNFDLN
jgi:hypothetical protein